MSGVATSLPAIAHSMGENPHRLNLGIMFYLLLLGIFISRLGRIADRSRVHGLLFSDCHFHAWFYLLFAGQQSADACRGVACAASETSRVPRMAEGCLKISQSSISRLRIGAEACSHVPMRRGGRVV